MASKRQFKPKRLREIYCHSVSRYSADNGLNLHAIDYTDDDNVTGYKCVLGVDKDGKPSYIKEFFSVMWGNDEVNVFVDLADNLEGFSLTGEVKSAVENGVPVSYTIRRGMFGRFHYNALITLDGTRYYFYIKTIRGASFKRIMDKFCK